MKHRILLASTIMLSTACPPIKPVIIPNEDYISHITAHIVRADAVTLLTTTPCLTTPMDTNHLINAGQGVVLEAVVGTVVVANCIVAANGVCEIRAPYPCGTETEAVAVRKRGDVDTHNVLVWDKIHIAPVLTHRRPSRHTGGE